MIMPYSGPQFDQAFEKFLRVISPQDIFEVGPGNGKYGKLVKAQFPTSSIEAIEAESSYIERFSLSTIYDKVTYGHGIDVMVEESEDAFWDLVILGDVLEHMPKSEGVDLLHYFVYRSRWLWLRWPIRYIQGAVDGVRAESHQSVWGKSDVVALRATYLMLIPQGHAEAFIVHGYPRHNDDLELLVELKRTLDVVETKMSS
jgi:phospholipid N-methyltransferase